MPTIGAFPPYWSMCHPPPQTARSGRPAVAWQPALSPTLAVLLGRDVRGNAKIGTSVRLVRDFRIAIFTVTWSDYDQEYEAEVSTAEQALGVLQSAQTSGDYAPLVQFALSPTGPFLAVSASDPAVVTFEESLDPPYFVSVGDPSRMGFVRFVYGCQESEMSDRHLVPLADGKEALRQFVSTERRPSVLVWEEV